MSENTQPAIQPSPPPQPVYQPREYLSVSTLMDFIRCPRRYFYRKSGLVLRNENLDAPNYGTAMHKAIPVALTQGLDPAIAAFTSVWGDRVADDKRNPSRARAQLGHFTHSHSGGRAIYVLQSPPQGTIETDETTSPYEIPAVIDVGLPVPLVVRIDGLVRHRDTGELWGLEFKTTSRLNASFFDSFEMNPQVLTYTMALQTLTKEPVRGVMVEGMLIDKSKVDNMTHPVLVGDHQVEAIYRWLRYWGTMLLDCEQQLTTYDANAFPQNFAGCSAYPHHYIPSFPCEYSNLCRVADWRSMAPLYDVKPDHKFVKLTKEGE